MGIVVTQEEQIRTLDRENRRLRAENEQLRADLDFVAIMADIDIDTEEGEAE